MRGSAFVIFMFLEQYFVLNRVKEVLFMIFGKGSYCFGIFNISGCVCIPGLDC